MGLNGFIFKKKKMKIRVLKRKKSWEPFRICLLNITVNPVQFGWKLAVLFSMQILNSSQDFFLFNILILFFFKYETIETHARAFLTLNISSIGTVSVLNKYCWPFSYNKALLFQKVEAKRALK